MDGLSGAVSGFAVVSITIQLVHGVGKLCTFWSNIKDAPAHVRTISADLKLLSSIFTAIDFECQHIEPDHVLKEVLETCQVSVKELASIVHTFAPGFESAKSVKRTWTSIKAVLKAEKLKKYQDMLESLKSTLHLVLVARQVSLGRLRDEHINQVLVTMTDETSTIKAISATSHALISWDLETEPPGSQQVIRAAGPSLVPSLNANRPLQKSTVVGAQLDSRARVRRIIAVDTSATYSPSGNINLKTQRISSTMTGLGDKPDYEPREQHESQLSLAFSPIEWLRYFGLNYVVQVSITQSCAAGWKWNFGTYNLVPDESPIFTLCARGDIKGTRNLFLKGRASVRDVDGSGRTLLWYAVSYVQPELYRFLVDEGAEETLPPVRSDRFYHPLVMTMIDWRRSRTKLEDTTNTFRVFNKVVDFDVGGSGWKMLTRWAFAYDRRFSPPKGVGELHLLEWILQYFWQDIKNNFYAQHCKLFLLLLLNWEDAFHCFFQKGPIKDVDAAGPPQEYTLLQQAITTGCNYSSMLKHHPNLHVIRYHSEFSIRPETPTSLAIYNARAFQHWQMALDYLKIDMDEFLEKELIQKPLVDAGWMKSTLRKLFEYKIDPLIIDDDQDEFLPVQRCADCGTGHCYFPGVKVQPYWLLVVAAIKSGIKGSQLQQLQSPMKTNSAVVSDHGGGVRPANVQSGKFGSCCPYESNAIVCMNCWLDYEETGKRPKQRREEGIVIEMTLDDEVDEGVEYADEDFSRFLIHGSRNPCRRRPLRRCTRSQGDEFEYETIYELAVDWILSGKPCDNGKKIDSV